MCASQAGDQPSHPPLSHTAAPPAARHYQLGRIHTACVNTGSSNKAWSDLSVWKDLECLEGVMISKWEMDFH